MKKLLIILCCSAIMLSFSQESDRILEIKALYSKIINDTSYKTDTVSWSISENEYSSPLTRTFVYSYFENNLSKLNCEIKQDDFFISSQYYFKDNVLFFAFLTYDYGSDKEENRLYFNKFGGIEKLLVNYGNGNKEITDIDEINKLKQVTLNWLEKGKANKENREKINKDKLNIQLNDSKVIIEKKSVLEEEKNLIAENDFSWYDRLPLPKWYRNLTLDDKPAPKWLFYWCIFLFIFLLFKKNRKENVKTKELEKNKGFFNRIVSYIWHKSMAGIKGSLINNYDNNPTVASAINDLEKSNASFQSTLEKIQARHGILTPEEKEKQKDKNEKETGIREINTQRRIREEKEKRKKQLEAMLTKNEQETGIRETNAQRRIREEKDKNEKETGIRETNQTRRNRERKEAAVKREKARKKQLIDKFGKENTKKIYNKEIWQGMTLEMLELSKGFPEHKKITEYKKTTTKQYFYDSYENRQKNIKYKLRVDLENDVVVGFKDL